MHKTYSAAVVGGGPAGIAAVGVLLDRARRSATSNTIQVAEIAWIDPKFGGGRLAKFPRVPSNTRVCLFTKFARSCASFQPHRNRVLKQMEEELDSQRGCQLRWAHSLCTELTSILRQDKGVNAFEDVVEECRKDQATGFWTLKLRSSGQVITAKEVILATGSAPKTLSHLQPQIDLETALDPPSLQASLPEDAIVAVWGSSHSAMLVLMNLLACQKVKRVYNYYRAPLKFAEIPDPVGRPDYIIHDNTGLKGETAEWVRDWHSEGIEEHFGGRLVRKQCGGSDFAPANDISVHICAVGYDNNALPIISPSPAMPPRYTSQGELLSEKDGQVIGGLFGFGIGFPERVVDVDGTPEGAVGMWKFMKYIQSSLK